MQIMLPPSLRAFFGYNDGAYDKRKHKQNHKHGNHKSALLTDYGKYEIRVLFGKYASWSEYRETALFRKIRRSLWQFYFALHDNRKLWAQLQDRKSQKRCFCIEFKTNFHATTAKTANEARAAIIYRLSIPLTKALRQI